MDINITTKKSNLIYDLVFNFGFDEEDLEYLSHKALMNLKVDLLVARKTIRKEYGTTVHLDCGTFKK